MRANRTALLVGLALATRPIQAVAWGDTAHEIVCEIAFREMSRPARDEVKRLIRLDPGFSRFNESCTWPDHPRKRASEHFINLSRSSTEIEGTACPLAGIQKCLLTAIVADVDVLADAATTDEQRIAALKFLGHWVGDVHQPMHV